MDHLTDEQFEGILQGEDTGLPHVKQCQDCRGRLSEKRAIAAKVRSAFGSVEAGPALLEKIRQALRSTARATVTAEPVRLAWLPRHSRQLWPTLAAAATVLIALVPLSLYLGAPSAAEAAQAELVKIHNHNISPDHEFFSEAEPEKLAEYFKTRLGFNPYFPELGHGMALRGCCVRHFRGKAAGAYVVDTPQGVVSVVVVTDKPESLGMMKGKFKRGPHIYWKSTFAKCEMVSVRIGDYSYCAVGEISHEYLAELLSRLVPAERE